MPEQVRDVLPRPGQVIAWLDVSRETPDVLKNVEAFLSAFIELEAAEHRRKLMSALREDVRALLLRWEAQ